MFSPERQLSDYTAGDDDYEGERDLWGNPCANPDNWLDDKNDREDLYND